MDAGGGRCCSKWSARCWSGFPRSRAADRMGIRTNRGHPGSMRFHLRKTLRLGPVRIHLTERGFSSWGLRVGRWTWNARTRRHTLDTPGPGYVRSRGRRR